MNLSKIQYLLDKNKIKAETKIDIKVLKKIKVLSKNYNKIKILGSGEIKKKIDINVDYISRSAYEKLKKIGASVSLHKKL